MNESSTPRYSRRIPAPQEPNALARAIERRRRDGLPILDLTETNPTRVALPYPEARILAALSAPEVLRYEPSPRGRREARAAVAALYAPHTPRIDAERVVLTASTSESYALLFKLVADPGDAVLVPQPSYPLFEHLAALEGLSAIPYRLRHAPDSGWRIDFASLAAACTDRVRALITVNPNNPTGSYLRRDELRELDAFCGARGLPHIADEVFFEHRAGGVPASPPAVAAAERALTFALGGLSKAAGLPQVKLGWIAAAGPDPTVEDALRRLEFVADAYLSVSAPAQAAAAGLLALRGEVQAAIRARVETNERILDAVWRGAGGIRLPREGGWSSVLRLPADRDDDTTALRLLETRGVLVHPGYFYDFAEDDALVLSLLPETPVFRGAVQALTEEILP